MWIQCTDYKLRSQTECTDGSPNNICSKLPVWWKWNNLFRLQTCTAGGRIVLYWGIFPSDFLSQLVEFCSEIFNCFQLFFTTIINFGYVQNIFDTFVWENIPLNFFSFFYTLKSCRLDSACILTICKLTPSAGQVGTRAEVREKAFPSFSLWTPSNLCKSDLTQKCGYSCVLLYSTLGMQKKCEKL